LYTIRFTDGALLELGRLSIHDRNRILDETARHLTYEPALATRRKKVIEGLKAPWDQIGPIWQLRVGDFRVFYDVLEDKKTVWVRAVRWKGTMSTEEILRRRKTP
jgi:mRNA-degrading endonuclease RelE of RelBE toxin-antitoxin system